MSENCNQNFHYGYTKSTPHKCPVCEGRGLVPPGFYDLTQKEQTSEPEFCRSYIKGVVWEYSWTPTSFSVTATNNPNDYTFYWDLSGGGSTWTGGAQSE